MNIQQLFAALQPLQNPAAQTLVIPAASVLAWPDINALITASCASQTLTVTGITTPPTGPVANTIVYQGVGTLFPPPGGIVQTTLTISATFRVDQSGAPQVLIRAQVPSSQTPWVLGDSLGGLTGSDLTTVEFEQALFYLTSQTTTVSEFQGTLNPYVDFQGVVALTGPLAFAKALLPSTVSRTVNGPVSLNPGPMPTMRLSPAGGAPINLAGIDFQFGVNLLSEYSVLPYYDPSEPLQTTISAPFSSAVLVASLAFSDGAPLALSMQVLPQSRLRNLSITGGATPLSSWTDLDTLTGGIDLGALIPSVVPPALHMVLKQLNLSLYFPSDASLPTVKSINFDIMMTVGDWALLPNDILTVQDVGALMTIAFAPDGAVSSYGSLYTHFTIVEEIAMVAALSIPALNFTAELQPGATVSVASLMASVMQKLTGKVYVPPIDMDISRLEMSIGILDRTFGFGADILTDWRVAFGEVNGQPLATFTFEGITFDINYDGQELQGSLTALAALNEGQFFFTATSPGNGAGWSFAGGLMSGSSLSVTKLLLGFMYPGHAIPGSTYGVPNLVIDTLSASLTTDAENTPATFTFEGGMSLSWTFAVFPGSPNFSLSASVSLVGRRGPAAPAQFALAYGDRMQTHARAVAPLNLVDSAQPWVISGDVQGSFILYGLTISAGYQFSPDNSALNCGIWYKNRGIQATVTQALNPKTKVKEAIVTVRLGDLSFGEIIEYLINLALPGEQRRLSSPWDILYQLNFKNLSLVVNLTTHDVEISYAINLDLTFARFDSIGLVYKNVNGDGKVYVQLSGDFLGQPFGGTSGEPLSWDVINDSAPEVPAKGPTLIDLRYVGLGQHIALSIPVAELDTVDKVITALKASMAPVEGGGNPLTDPGAASLRYDGNSNWMFGLDATILDTVSLSVVFFDPILYGGVLTLAGERAGSLAGLRLEMLYRKITNDIGELSVDLRVPDAFRHIEMGEVSITLGVIHLDIYTNGNFRVNLGFPYKQDFSVSFALEVFPFIGEGGFYFAYLTGATSERVPLITNGVFNPVIEAGLGLAVGVGKDFQAGPLKAGLKVEVLGIFEGVFAPFNPYDKSLAAENYFWIQGTAGIVGRLYGSVDFVIIRADVSIVAEASVTFIVEAHRPSTIDLRLSVTAKASVQFLVFTVHFSFDLTIEESFTIGTATATPWIVGTHSERLAPHAYHSEAVRLGRGGRPAPPLLRQQRSQAPIRRLTRLRHARHHLAGLISNPAYRSLHWARQAESNALQPRLADTAASPPPWPPLAVFGAGAAKTARLQFAPLFTIADPASLYGRTQHAYPATGADPSGNQMEIVLGFIAESSVPPAAYGHEQAKIVSVDHVHHLDADDKPPMATMVEAFFRWAAQAGAAVTGGQNLSLLALQDLLDEITDLTFQQATFKFSNLDQFLAQSLFFEVAAYPTGAAPSASSGAFVPVMPPITAALTDRGVKTERAYASYKPVSAAYAANLPAYFQQLLTSATSVAASKPTVTGAPPAPPVGSISAASLAELMFSQYFVLLTQASLQGAIALLQNYPYAYPAANGPTLQDIAASFPTLTTTVSLARGQSLNDLALETGHHPAALAAANPAAARGDSDQVDLLVAVTALSIVEDNPSALIATGFTVPMPALPYQVRAGQSLTDIAAAIPFVTSATPLTALSVGSASLEIGDLLRAGAHLQVPAFTYTPVSGDTQHFLSAFFQVRNSGVTGVPYLDWYEQAIATLNPDVQWAALTTHSAPIQVPIAHLNSVPASVTYSIHQGDSLARIAAALALFQAMDSQNNPAVTAPLTIAAVTHVIASADTLASLLIDFPGLIGADLITANATAPILTPLTVLQLPPFTATLPAGQTLQSWATAYDLGLADLVDIVGTTAGIYVGTTALNIRDVPAQRVDVLVADLQATAQLNLITTQVANFMAHGLRAPAPDDTTFTNLTPQQVLNGDFNGTLYGLYDLIGQQFSWPDPATPVALSLTQSSSAWLRFVSTLTSESGSAQTTPQMLALNPRLANGKPLRPGLILATDTITQIDLSIDAARFAAYLPATTVTLNATAPTALINFSEAPIRYNCQVTQHWQAGKRPTLPACGATASPGEPSLWPLPSNLQQLADAGGALPFALNSVPLAAAPGTVAKAVISYAWGVQITIDIARVAATSDVNGASQAAPLGSAWTEGLYLVKGASGEAIERLYALWTYLADAAKVKPPTDSGALYLLYAPNGAGTTPKGYCSDAVDMLQTVMLKTNLSTVTRVQQGQRDTLADTPGAAIYSATLADSLAFLTLMWEASVVVEGGFYLRYDCAGAGLPDALFDDTGKGSLQMLCLLDSQTSASTSGGKLLALNNVAVVGDNLDASAVQVFAQQTGAGAPATRIATNPPGTVGFEFTRLDPTPPDKNAPTPAQLAGMLYGLVGYKIGAATGYVASNEAVPQGPSPTSDDLDGTGANVLYSQAICIYPRATPAGLIAQKNPWLPAAASDPYAGVASTSAAAINFTSHDVFGNKAVIADPLAPVSVPNRYTDRLKGVGDWPGTNWSYTLSGTSPSVALEIHGALQANTYLPDPTVSSAKALASASAHALKFRQAFYQISRPHIGVSLASSFASTAMTAPLAPLIGYVSAACAFTSQIAALPIRTWTVSAGQTLAQVATAFSVSARDLLRDNLDRSANALFATQMSTPTFAQVKHQQTLNAFAAQAGLTGSALLSQWGNDAAAIIPAGVDLIIAATTGALSAGKTLSDYAMASQCTVADIARANATTAGLIADGIVVVAGGVMVTTSSSTFTSLVTDFTKAAVATNGEQIATLNQFIPDFFSSGSAPTTYVVDRRVNAAAAPLATVVTRLFSGDLSHFIALNGDLPGLITQDNRLQIALTTGPAPAQGLHQYLSHQNGLTLADFAAANGVSVMTAHATLLLPAILDPTPLAATPYGIQAGVNFGQIATLFGVTADVLGQTQQNLPGLFVPKQAVTVAGCGTVATDASDSLSSLITKFPAGAQPSLTQLVNAISGQAGLMLAGAALVCPVTTAQVAGTGVTLTLNAIAAAFLTSADGLKLAKCNAALGGFLKRGASFSITGHSFTVGPDQTLVNSFNLVNAQLLAPLAYDDFLTAMLDQAVVDPATKVLLPPPRAALSAALPATPAMVDTLTLLHTSLTLSRPSDEVDDNFRTIPQVREASTCITAQSEGASATLSGFATAVARAYGGAVWIGASGRADQGPQKHYAVRFDSPADTFARNAIKQVSFGAGAAGVSEFTGVTYMGLPPLANALVSRAASVRTYLSGSEPPFSVTAEPTLFQAIDVNAWAGDFLATLDLVLSPGYASAGYAATASGAAGSSTFTALVAAKASLAEAIAGQLAPIESGQTPISLADARSALEQVLRANLSTGFATDALIQVPSTVVATFSREGQDIGAHRLTGKVSAAPVSLSTSTTLHSLATTYQVSLEGMAELLAATPNILATGTELSLNSHAWTIAAHDNLNTGIAALQTDLAAFTTAFATQAPLFREGTALTIDGYSAKVAFGATLQLLADSLDVSLRYLALANQNLDGLLTGVVYVMGRSVTITPATSSLVRLAQSQSLAVALLAELIAGQSVLTQNAQVNIVRWSPEYSLNPGKVSLDTPAGALTLLLNVKNKAQFRQMFVNLDFDVTALEFQIAAANDVEGYERSRWMSFVNPLPANAAQLGGADIATDIGQLAVPIPLRAYPVTPRLVNQRAQATYPSAAIDPHMPLAELIRKIEAWSYYAGFELTLAAQDTAVITVGFNYVPSIQSEARKASKDPFAALAEWASSAASIKADLVNLIVPGTGSAAAGRSAIKAMADLATKIAANWGFVALDSTSANDDPTEGMVATEPYGFELQTRTRSGSSGEPLLDALVLVNTASPARWGPNGQIPNLGYIDGAGVLQTLVKPTVAPGPASSSLTYLFTLPVEEARRRTYVLWYDDLNVIVYQNARASLSILRNRELIPGQRTNLQFVYQTPQLTFTNLAVPDLRWDTSVSIGSGATSGLAAALTSTFTHILGDPPTAARAQQSLTGRYGYRLAAVGAADSPIAPGDLVSMTPMFYRPTFVYTASVPTDTSTAVTTWFIDYAPQSSNIAFLSLGLQIYSTLMPNRKQPLIAFTRLDYGLVE